MIKLSRLSDYAVVVLETLSRDTSLSLSASQIAIASGLPEPTVAKVLKLMASGGLVISSRGVNGGYAMAKKPEDMNVFEIISAIEGRLGLTACVDGDHESCALQGSCAMSGRWDVVNKAVQKTFESISLADMTRKDQKAA